MDEKQFTFFTWKELITMREILIEYCELCDGIDFEGLEKAEQLLDRVEEITN